jgi:hypothetical protein
MLGEALLAETLTTPAIRKTAHSKKVAEIQLLTNHLCQHCHCHDCLLAACDSQSFTLWAPAGEISIPGSGTFTPTDQPKPLTDPCFSGLSAL